MKHTCIIPSPRPTDYVKDENSPIVFHAATSGDWTDHIDFFERQKLSFETDGCVLFTAQESFDAQMNDQIENGKLPQTLIDQFTAMGYMDANSLDGKPRFHSSPRFLHVLAGTRHGGTPLATPWDIMRKYGVLPWTDLPFDATTTEYNYFSPIPQPLLDKARSFLFLVGGKSSIQYHWIVNGGQSISKMKAALPQAPLCLGTPVCEPWDQVQPPTCSGQQPAHSTMCYKIDSAVEIFDHYAPFLKKFAYDYPIPYVIQGIFTYVPPPPQPQLPTEPNIPQVKNWLAQLADWLTLLLNRLKGRATNQ